MRDVQPGPGQEMARRGIRVAVAGIIGRGARVQIEWVPGHAGVEGNELADDWAVDEVRRGSRGEKGEDTRRGTERISLAFLKAQREKEAVRAWRGEILRRAQRSRALGYQGRERFLGSLRG